MTIPSISLTKITLDEYRKDSQYYTDEKNVVCVYWYLRYIEMLSPLNMFERCLGIERWLVENVAIDDFALHADKVIYGAITFNTKIWFRNDIDLVAFRLRWGIK